MDLVMLVIAADEGVMPQTREHLEICQLLGVRKGLVALTKCDMVDMEWLELVVEEVRDYLNGSFLEGAPIIPVSAKTATGLGELKSGLATLAASVEEKSSVSPFRLPVDRVFTIAGFGTVVTGTLLSGEIKTGYEVELLPSALSSRVRSVQTHGRKTEQGSAGQRVAVNLQGVELGEIMRGDVIVPRGAFRATRAVDARFAYLPSAPRELKHRSTLRLHSATYEVPAQVILLDRDTLEAGETAFVQLRLKHPVLLLPGDHFIVRSYSPQITVGGGVVIDPAPPRRRRRSEQALELLRALSDGEDVEKIRLLAQESLLSGVTLEELITRSGLSAKRTEAALAGLLSQGLLVQMVREPRIFLAKEQFVGLKSQLLDGLEGYLRENPLKEGIGKEELKSHIPKRSDSRFFGPLLAALEKEGKALVDRDLVRIPGREAGDDDVTGSDLLAALEASISEGGMEPPTLKELAERLGRSEKDILEHLKPLLRSNRAIKVKSDIFYAPEPLAKIRELLLKHLAAKGEVTPAEFRELTGLSRKFNIPLLEYFDQEKLTIRVGERRLQRKK
jgi:selenocysteine-specific elongation factor